MFDLVMTRLFFFSTILLLCEGLTQLVFDSNYSLTLLFSASSIPLLGDLVCISEGSQLKFL